MAKTLYILPVPFTHEHGCEIGHARIQFLAA